MKFGKSKFRKRERGLKNIEGVEKLFCNTTSMITKTIANNTQTGNSSDNLWCLEGKTCIVTGASSGIGFQTALGLAKRGARVILACRDGSTAEAAVIAIRRRLGFKTEAEANKKVVWSHLDLASAQSVRRFAGEIYQTEKYLHVLINNAAILPQRKRQVRLEGDLELTFATNHLGHFLLTDLLLPLLKKSLPSRIIVVSCDSYKMCSSDVNTGSFNGFLADPNCHNDPKNFDPWMACKKTPIFHN